MRARRSIIFAVCLSAAVLAAAPACLEGLHAEVSTTRSLPFSIGERLVYSIKWDPPWYLFFIPTIDAGEVEVQLVGETEYKGKKALKLLLKMRSSGMLAAMSGMRIEDEYVFFTEPGTFCTLGFSKKIRQGKRKRRIDVEYLRETRQLFIHEIDESVVPPLPKKDALLDNIPSCVHDPISALYSFRMSKLRPGYAQSFVIGHDDRIKEVRASVEQQEGIETAFGKLAAWRISTAALMGELFREGGQCTFWLSADERKLPLQLELRVRLGRVLGRLKSRPS